MGAMTAGATKEQLKSLSDFAEKIGLAFQIADDVLNATGSREEMGKETGTDKQSGKLTYVAAYGVEGARERAGRLIRDAKNALASLPGNPEPLSALADYVINRRT
jgi:geranylgeranyl diphosphate synthase type II